MINKIICFGYISCYAAPKKTCTCGKAVTFSKHMWYVSKSGLLPAVSADDILHAAFALPEEPKSEHLPAVVM